MATANSRSSATTAQRLVRYRADPVLESLPAGPFRPGRANASTFLVTPWPGGDRLLCSAWEGSASKSELWRLDRGRLVEEFVWAGGYVHAALTSDLDRDGEPELYVGTGMGGRTLHRLDPGDPWHVSAPHLVTSTLNSDIVSIRETDLDVDGQPELMVAASSWGGVRYSALPGHRRKRPGAYCQVPGRRDPAPLGRGPGRSWRSSTAGGQISPPAVPIGLPDSGPVRRALRGLCAAVRGRGAPPGPSRAPGPTGWGRDQAGTHANEHG